jgi:hypothetical protein
MSRRLLVRIAISRVARILLVRSGRTLAGEKRNERIQVFKGKESFLSYSSKGSVLRERACCGTWGRR